MADRYFTTTLPYVNSVPHLGHALEFIQADCLIRHFRLKGDNVFFNTGTDEHGLKVYRKAEEQGMDPQGYVDTYAEQFKKFCNKIAMSYDAFIRTSDPKHKNAAQEIWKRCYANGDIYKKEYTIKYCVGCELEKTDSELVDDKCEIHSNLELELINEENYFFRFSKYQDRLLELYDKYPDFVIPASRQKEIREFVKRGLQDFSISRLRSKMPWGVPVPGDDDHVMYVWFDALVSYISTLDWPQDNKLFDQYWGTIDNPIAMQFAGKDNLRQQSAMWQSMLLSAGLPNSRRIFIHGYINTHGQKMSKTLGNVIDPVELIDTYGLDATRFWLLHDISPVEDGDFVLEKFKDSINGNLANGIGNLVSRVYTMAEKYGVFIPRPDVKYENTALDEYDIQGGIKYVLAKAASIDKTIAETEPFKVFKTDPAKAKEIVAQLVVRVYEIAILIEPFLPGFSAKTLDLFEGKVDKALVLPLFPKVESAYSVDRR